MENIYYDPDQKPLYSSGIGLEMARVRRLPIGRRHVEEGTIGLVNEILACWTKSTNGIIEHPHRPVALVLGPKQKGIFQRISKHYFDLDYYRWLRLEGCVFWIYVDIFYIFTAWDHVLVAAKADLQRAVRLDLQEGKMDRMR
jgi:hypothetical protein